MRRGLGLVAFGSALALALVCAIGWAERNEIARSLLLRGLEARGVERARLSVKRVGAGELALREIAIGAPEAPDLTVESADLAFSLVGLRAGRLDALHVSGVRMRAALGDGGLALGALEPLFAARAGGAASRAPLLLPAPVVTLRDAELALTTPQGVAACTFGGRLLAGDDGELAGNFDLSLEHPLVGAKGAVVLTGTLEALSAELVLALRDGREPARVAPATLRGRVEGALRALTFDLAIDGAEGRLVIRARGEGDAVARSGRADLTLAKLVFEPQGLQPGALLPAFEPLLANAGVSRVSGSIEGRGAVTLDAGTPSLKLDLALREVGFDTALARVAGVSGTLALRAPRLRTPKGQMLSVALLDPGVPLRDGTLAFQLRPDGTVALEATRFDFAGGELRAENLILDLAAETTPVRLQARDLDLAALLALSGLPGIEATGRIGGELPLVHGAGALRVTEGVLRASPEGGTIRYRPSASTRALADSRPNDLGIAVSAFADFHYRELEARIEGDVRGDLHIALHVKGANPEFQNGQPIELNLNLEARLLDLVRSGAEAYRLPEEVQKRLRGFSDGETK